MLTFLALIVASAARAMSGYAPDCAVTFFASPKKVTEKRRAEVRAAARFLALLASGGVGLNSLRSDNARRLPPSWLCCSVRQQGSNLHRHSGAG